MEGSRAHMERMEPDTVAILLIEACTHKAVVTAKGLDSFTPDHKLDGRNGLWKIQQTWTARTSCRGFPKPLRPQHLAPPCLSSAGRLVAGDLSLQLKSVQVSGAGQSVSHVEQALDS